MTSKLTQLAQQKSARELQTMSQKSFKWLATKIASLKKPDTIPGTIAKEDFRKVSRFILGRLYFFYYDPKFKDELPYYDRFPLVLILERYPDGFLGLNLHYLPLRWRLIFMDKLMQFAVMNEENDPKKLKVTYDLLNMTKRFKEFRPCIKRYLTIHIKSKILMVEPKEWDVALFLPIQQFKKARVNEVWKDSIEEIRNS